MPLTGNFIFKIAGTKKQVSVKLFKKGECNSQLSYKSGAYESLFTTSEESLGECYFKTGDLGPFEIHNLVLKGLNKKMILRARFS